jgi:Flp pilus assembly protein TadG
LRKALGKLRHLRRCETGTVAIEFAIIGMVMIMISFALIEFGRGFYLYNRMSHAADLAIRKTFTNPEVADQTLVEAVRAGFSGESALAQLTVTITPKPSSDTSSEFDYRILEVKIPFMPLVPGFVTDGIDLTVVRKVLKITIPGEEVASATP